MIPDSHLISPKKIGRPKGSKDKAKRKEGSGLHNSNRNKTLIDEDKGIVRERGPGTGTKHKNKPPRPYITSLYHQTEFLEIKLTSHRKNVIDTYNPLGQFSEPRENPFKIDFK